MDVLLELDWKNFADELNNDVRTAMVRAINRVADRARTQAARAVRDQVSFPASYLNPSLGHLQVTARARGDSLVAAVTGSDRPTSLARFRAPKSQDVGKVQRGGGVGVVVRQGGRRKTIRRGFLINLKRGTDATGNVGLAVRTDGGPPVGAWKPKEIGKNLYLVYGASVDQVLLAATDGNGVYEEISPEMLELLETEFARQLELLRNKNA